MAEAAVISVGYWCDFDKKFVLSIRDMFLHPHLGMKSCFVCRECGHMVYPKEKRG